MSSVRVALQKSARARVLRISVICFVLILSIPGFGESAWASEPSPFLRIYHLNVGQGDSTLIIGTNGKTLLVDGGETNEAVGHVLNVIETLGIETIDYLIVTHFDSDHYKGAVKILKTEFGNGTRVFDRGLKVTEEKAKQKLFQDYKALFSEVDGQSPLHERAKVSLGPFLEGEHAPQSEGVHPSLLSSGEHPIYIRCVAVNGRVVAGDESGEEIEGLEEENANSIALYIKFGDFDYFIGGDLTKAIEVPAGFQVGNLDVLRVNHHGSLTSSDENFLESIQPEVGIISVGAPGTRATAYKLPRIEIQQRLLDSLNSGSGDLYQTNTGWLGESLFSELTAKEGERLHVATRGADIVLITNGQSYTINGKTYRTD